MLAYSHCVSLFPMKPRSKIAALVFVLLAARPIVVAQHAVPGPTRAANAGTKPVAIPPAFQAQVEAVAQAMTHFATGAIIANRPLRIVFPPPNLLGEQTHLLTDLRAMGHEPEALRLLLKDSDPRVRTVALGALFVREDPRDLPFIAALMNDTAPTVPDLHESLSAMSAVSGLQPLDQVESSLTVGRVARSMIHFYFEAAHIPFNGDVVGQPYYPQASTEELLAAFNTYWAERNDRASCASWYLVKLERATRRTDPVQRQYQADIDAAFAQIEALPSPERDWTLFFAVNGEVLPDAREIVPDATLLRAAKAIGPDALMNFLLLKPFSSDPDLRFTGHQPDPRNEVFVLISRFILEHAPELLRPTDSAVLRANATNELQHWQSTTPMWMAAANALDAVQDHAKGVAQMKADFAKFPANSWGDRNDQMKLAIALWRLSGAMEKDFLVQWFYSLPSTENISHREEFLRAVDTGARPDTPDLLKAIVADPRFDTTDWAVLVQLLQIAGGGITTSLVDWHELYDHQPNQYRPDQIAVLASWRNVLRRHLGLPEHSLPVAAS